ncbi:MAG: carboxypeptidase-like regulatory domain-containing protein, partial [Tannerellaceae bacterium]|nr:carboxypeptidase-like regulatory domain-containing protein [Tannerellaceae bacterium]
MKKNITRNENYCIYEERKVMNKLVFTLIVFFVYILPAQTQNTLKGNIHQDESGEGLFLTTIRVLTKDSAFVNGGITDDNGFFEVKDIKSGKYILAVSNIG